MTAPVSSERHQTDDQDEEKNARHSSVTSAPSQEPDQSPGGSLTHPILLTLILANAAFMNTAIAQVCIIELPQISQQLQIPPARQQWIITTPSLAASCSLLIFGRLADLFGRRLIFRAGTIGVAVSCLITPFTSKEIAFDVFRGLQGLSSAACLPTAVGIIFSAYATPRGRLYAISTFSAGFPLGNVVGSVLGGVVGQYLNWKWTFWIITIEMAIAACIAFIAIPPDRRAPREQASSPWVALRGLDWLGLSLITTALVCLLVALSEGNVSGWNSPWVLTLLIASCVLFFPVFLLREHVLGRQGRKDEQLAKLELFRNPTYAAAQVVCLIFWAVFNIFTIFATYLYQDYQGLDEIETTLRFLPSGITGVLAVFLSSQIVSHINGDILAGMGLLALSVSNLLYAVPIPPNTTYWAVGFPAMVLLTLGADTLYPCLTLLVMRSIPPEDQAVGAAIFQTIGQIGRSLGIAIATALSIAVSRSTGGDTANVRGAASALEGYRAANWFSFGLGILAMLIAVVMFRDCGKLGSKK